MGADLSNLFHDSSKDPTGGGLVNIPQDEKEWPEDWKTVYYKTYPRFRSIALPEPEGKGDLFETIEGRGSRRDFSGAPIPADKLSTLLKYSAGIMQETADLNPRRAHPSGGARYPLELYPVVLSGDTTIPSGVFHYAIRDHALDVLWQREFSKEDAAQLFYYDFAQRASVAIVLTAVFARSQAKYGERGYRYVLLEAGHIGQNIYLTAEALGLKCSAIAGVSDRNLETLIDVDGYTESVIYVLVLGA